jgi:hypothetical protein
MLVRCEIENYLFDKEVLKKFCIDNSKIFDELRYDNKVTDIKCQELKSIQQEIQASCQVSGDIQQFKKGLAKYIYSDSAVFKEIEMSIF